MSSFVTRKLIIIIIIIINDKELHARLDMLHGGAENARPENDGPAHFKACK